MLQYFRGHGRLRTGPHTLPPGVRNPRFSPVPGEYATTQNIVLSTPTAGAEVFYTIDGSDPTIGSTMYTVPIVVAVTTTIKAIGIDGIVPNSAIVTGIYVIAPSEDRITEDGNLRITQAGEQRILET